MIAALFVQPYGVYADLPGVEIWTESRAQQSVFGGPVYRDAREYRGPHRVVAHPPCTRWCRLAGLVEKRYGYKRGDDGGCFESALASVRAWGGVLEHPAYSDAWPAFGLPAPGRSGGWSRGECGGWACHVEQGNYGHPAKKATWLYAFGLSSPPELRWGAATGKAWVGWCGNATRGAVRERVSKRAASATPVAFRDELIGIARSAAQEAA